MEESQIIKIWNYVENVTQVAFLTASFLFISSLGDTAIYQKGLSEGRQQGYSQGIDRAELIEQAQRKLDERPSRLREISGL